MAPAGFRAAVQNYLPAGNGPITVVPVGPYVL
jgi:hypothetical protein